jgi:hypothetical protein
MCCITIGAASQQMQIQVQEDTSQAKPSFDGCAILSYFAFHVLNRRLTA